MFVWSYLVGHSATAQYFSEAGQCVRLFPQDVLPAGRLPCVVDEVNADDAHAVSRYDETPAAAGVRVL